MASTTDVSLDEARQAADEAREGDALRENDAGVPEDLRVDYEEYDVPSVRLHPESLLTFDHIAGVSINQFGNDDFLDTEQNLKNAGPRGYGYDVTLTVAEPEAAEGDVWLESDDEYTAYRVLGDPSADESPYDVDYNSDGDAEGVDLGMGDFEGERVDEIDAEYAQIEISARRAVGVLGALDTAGRWAHSRDGDFVEGIIETPPNHVDDDLAPRAIGFPELRADMVDQQGAIAFTFDVDDGEEPTTQTFVDVALFRLTDDGLDALTALTKEDDDYALPTYPRGGNLYWDDHDGPEDVDGETVDEAAASISFADDGDTTFDGLAEQDKQYVRDAEEFLDGHEADDLRDVIEDFESTYADQVENGEATGDLDANEMADIVASRV